MSGFKVGDKVRRIVESFGLMSIGDTGVIDNIRENVTLQINGFGYDADFFELCKYPNPPHKHVKEMIAFAEGANVRGRNGSEYNWNIFKPHETMTWHDKWEYEIVPEKTTNQLEIERIESEMRKVAKTQSKLADDLKNLKDN